MSSKKPRVLVADDDPGVRKLVEYNLSLEGYEVIAVSGGKEALRRAQNETPDLLLLDVMMPDLNGLRVCQSLRSTSQMPIIMLTAKTEEESVLKGFGLGADDYVTKPFSSEELMARVKAVLRRSLSSEHDFQAAQEQLLAELQVQAILITRGPDGMSLLGRDEPYTHIPAANVSEVFDVTGAGDTVIAVAALALAAGLDLLSAAHLANFAAGLVVRKLGNATATPEELAWAIENW